MMSRLTNTDYDQGILQLQMISEKGVYGMMSGVVTTVLLQPFENIKMALMIPPHKLESLHQQGSTLNNIATSCRYIYSHDGIKGFYKGLVAATLKAAFGCYLYFTGLRYFEEPNMGAMQNFMASSFSRLLSTFVTNPLNVIETRFQLAFFHGYTSVYAAVKDIQQKQGNKAFFSGGLSSCIKEGAFGGFHYMFYEELKDKGVDKAIAGISSGMLATAITHPFEIIRAKLQTLGLTSTQKLQKIGISRELKRLMKEGGWSVGLAPRLVKKPIANMLTFLLFQILEDQKDNKNI